MELHELPAAGDGLFLRFQIEDRVPPDQLFRFSERSADNGRLSIGHADAHCM